jgi:hypothetical protein
MSRSECIQYNELFATAFIVLIYWFLACVCAFAFWVRRYRMILREMPKLNDKSLRPEMIGECHFSLFFV